MDGDDISIICLFYSVYINPNLRTQVPIEACVPATAHMPYFHHHWNYLFSMCIFPKTELHNFIIAIRTFHNRLLTMAYTFMKLSPQGVIVSHICRPPCCETQHGHPEDIHITQMLLNKDSWCRHDIVRLVCGGHLILSSRSLLVISPIASTSPLGYLPPSRFEIASPPLILPAPANAMSFCTHLRLSFIINIIVIIYHPVLLVSSVF
jgi:hypothetical protein